MKIVQGECMVPNDEPACLEYEDGVAEVRNAVNFLRCDNPAVQIILPDAEDYVLTQLREKVEKMFKYLELDDQFLVSWAEGDAFGRVLIIRRTVAPKTEEMKAEHLFQGDDFIIVHDIDQKVWTRLEFGHERYHWAAVSIAEGKWRGRMTQVPYEEVVLKILK